MALRPRLTTGLPLSSQLRRDAPHLEEAYLSTRAIRNLWPMPSFCSIHSIAEKGYSRKPISRKLHPYPMRPGKAYFLARARSHEPYTLLHECMGIQGSERWGHCANPGAVSALYRCAYTLIHVASLGNRGPRGTVSMKKGRGFPALAYVWFPA